MAFFTMLTAGITLAGGSCTGANQTSQTGANTIQFRDSAQLLSQHRAAIRAILAATLPRVAAELDLTGVTVTVLPGVGIEGYGLGGYTPSANNVQITIDPTFPSLAQVLPERLPPLLAHELHHAKRWRGPGYGSTLLQALVSEGLADHFAIEFLAAPVAPWSDAFPRDQTAALLALASTEFDSESYDHARWFFGANPPPPRWAGYTLGFRLVEAYQTAHPGATAAELVWTLADAFRP